jgi:hypothetical protein
MLVLVLQEVRRDGWCGITGQQTHLKVFLKYLMTYQKIQVIWYHSLFYFTKGSGICAVDTFYSKAPADTFVTPIITPQLIATAGYGEVNLTALCQSTISSGSYIFESSPDGVNFTAIDTLAFPDSNQTTHSGLNPDSLVYYRVKLQGTNTSSPYSFIVSATTYPEVLALRYTPTSFNFGTLDSLII